MDPQRFDWRGPNITIKTVDAKENVSRYCMELHTQLISVHHYVYLAIHGRLKLISKKSLKHFFLVSSDKNCTVLININVSNKIKIYMEGKSYPALIYPCIHLT